MSDLIATRDAAAMLGVDRTYVKQMMGRVGVAPARVAVIGGMRANLWSPADIRRGQKLVERRKRENRERAARMARGANNLARMAVMRAKAAERLRQRILARLAAREAA